ncbi:antibiotic biosynthesis monooxygenase family protein [Pseudomonas japonica]|nr:antibiotic biosynthesis monooxygenase family protein [Pseudomonas japonica]MBA1244736.1 hypothetical protein [Pseudomonas japonica]MBA1291552.1 hypothetical protein [Pseudomonas japonica]
MTQQPLISHRAAIRTWPGRSCAVGEQLARLVEATRPLPGCLSIAARREPSNVHTWHLSMCWEDHQAFATWLGEPAAAVFTDLLNQRLIQQIDIQPGDPTAQAELRRAG